MERSEKTALGRHAFARLKNKASWAAGTALATSLLALTLAGPASAGERPDSIINTIFPPGTPLGVVIDPVRGTLYSTTNSSSDGGLVSVIDEATNTITATIPVGKYPYAIAVDPIHYMVWVTNYLSASVSAIDERTNTVIATLPTGSTPHDITVDPFRGTVYVANDGGRSVTVIDEATLTVTTTVTVPNNLNTVGIGVDPVRGIVGVEAFASGFTSSYLLELDERTNQFVDTITLTASTGAPERLAVDPILGRAYAPQYYAGTVQVVDEKTGTVIKTIVSTTATNASDGGPGTGSLALDLLTETLYVVNENVGTVSVINPIKGFVEHTINIPNASDKLSGIAVDPIRGLAYVTNYNNNSISVISTGKGAACKDLQNFPLLPLLCETSLYKSKPGEDRPSWPWTDAANFH